VEKQRYACNGQGDSEVLVLFGILEPALQSQGLLRAAISSQQPLQRAPHQ
jgi:hypothetical protein